MKIQCEVHWTTGRSRSMLFKPSERFVEFGGTLDMEMTFSSISHHRPDLDRRVSRSLVSNNKRDVEILKFWDSDITTDATTKFLTKAHWHWSNKKAHAYGMAEEKSFHQQNCTSQYSFYTLRRAKKEESPLNAKKVAKAIATPPTLVAGPPKNILLAAMTIAAK